MRIDEFKKAIGAISGVNLSDQAVIVARITDSGLTAIHEAGDREALSRLYKSVVNAAPVDPNKGGNI